MGKPERMWLLESMINGLNVHGQHETSKLNEAAMSALGPGYKDRTERPADRV